jgi:lipoate-protein ligase A
VGGSILQHGSILEGWDGSLQGGCLGLTDDSELRRALITLTDLLGAPPRREVLAEAIVAGFAATFGVSFDRSEPTSEETAWAKLLERERYGHPRWTFHRDGASPAGGAEDA